MFFDFLTFYQIFLAPKAKRSASISNKHNRYELPNDLPIDLRLRMLGSLENLENYKSF